MLVSGPDMSSEYEFYKDLLEAVQSIADAQQQMAEALNRMTGPPSQDRKISTEDERTALAVVAVAQGASSFADIARELKIPPSTAQRSPGIRRALEATVRDRRINKSEAEDFQWHQ